jgi:hypothetical protein
LIAESVNLRCGSATKGQKSKDLRLQDPDPFKLFKLQTFQTLF